MKKPLIPIALFLTLTLLSIFSACKQPQSIVRFKKAYTPYISAYTFGTVSRASDITIRLTTNAVTTGELGQELDADLISFSPQIKGSVVWSDQRTLRFSPDEWLPSGQLYTGTLELGEILQMPDSLSVFEFNFRTYDQAMEVVTDVLMDDTEAGPGFKKLIGSVITVDLEEAESIQKTLTAEYQSADMDIEWLESRINSHKFQIKGLKRQEKDDLLTINWDGHGIGYKENGDLQVTIPAIGQFYVSDIRVINEPDQYVKIEFTEALDPDQELYGLITLNGNSLSGFTIESNVVNVYQNGQMSGDYQLAVYKGIKNAEGKGLDKQFIENITFEEIQPAVRLVGKGIILPASNGLVFPFEAVNLKAVDVTVIKIFEGNVLQFLQVNDLDGKNEIKRVGQIVKRKTVQLNPSKPGAFQQWTRYGIKLDELIEQEPGAIYHVGISFRKQYSLYNCGEDDGSENEQGLSYTDGDWNNFEAEESSNWDYWDNYFYGYNYDWSNRDNPCHSAYYNRNRFKGRNVMASDLGLLAKLGKENHLHISLTDINSTDPIAGAVVDVYDFQLQKTASLTTDKKGMADAILKNKPFAIVASKENQKGYLKLQDGNSLSVSRFDVSGAGHNKGLKGYLYGDRGVWRPGDSVYLTLMLSDANNSLPDYYPVEFRLDNARGQTVFKKTVTPEVSDIYDLRFKTDPEDATGNWKAIVKAGGVSIGKTLKIETIKPNRLKINIDFGGEKVSASNGPIHGTLISTWLHGAKAKELKYDIEVQLQPVKTKFTDYGEFNFDDPTQTFYSSGQQLAEGILDENGQVEFDADLDVEDIAPGRLRANIRTRVFEKSGDFSVDKYSFLYDPYAVYLGVKTPKGDKARNMLLTDTTHKVEIVALDSDGKPVANRQITVELFKIGYRWWWDQDEGNISSYLSRNYSDPIETATVRTGANGIAVWGMRVDYPNWGAYIIRVHDDEGDHSSGKPVFIDWPGWAGRGQREQPGGAAMLSFTADKTHYKTGEKINLVIPTSGKGQALISVENSFKVLKTFWTDTDEGETKISITATPEMTPNIYVNVTLIQPHGQEENSLPIRLYGIIPIMVEDPVTHINPVIEIAKVLLPESTGKVSVSEKNGKAMNYTIAIVDEGLLDLTRFKTPDPWGHFYAKEALGVKTWDVFDKVLGAYGGNLEQLLSIGGDGEETQEGDRKANRFKAMVRYLGPFTLEKGKTAQHSFDIPQYVGSVKVMVVASNEDAYGKAEKAVPVRKPLMVLGTLPRVLSTQETISLPVTVFAMENHVKVVTVTVEVSDAAQIVGNKQKKISFAEIGDQIVDFEIGTTNNTGLTLVTISAKAGNETATHTIELDVRNPNPFIMEEEFITVQPGQTGRMEFAGIGIEGTNSATLEISAIPPLNLASRLQYLIRYPHGCVEQTTSSVFPQLYVMDLLKLNEEQKQQVDHFVKAGIAKLNNFQNPNGSVSYWPGSNSVDNWSSVYAGHFMMEAKSKGYKIPYGFLKKWRKHQKKISNDWLPSHQGSDYGRSSELIQAYRLFVLALDGSPELGAMNRMKEVKALEDRSVWRLAAAYALAGYEDIAKNMVEELSTYVSNYKEHSYSYGSYYRDKALILETLCIIGEDERTVDIAEQISNGLSSNGHLNTQAISYSLLAMSRYAGLLDKSAVEFTYSFKGQATETVKNEQPIFQVGMNVNADINTLEINSNHDRPLYARVILRGQPPIGSEEAFHENIFMIVSYKTMDGEPLNISRLDQGQDLVMEVELKNPGRKGHYRNLALTSIFPTCWEISNSRMDGFNYQGKYTSTADYEDFRDDRVHSYFDLGSGQSKTFRYVVNASYIGKCYAPAIYVESMYEHEIRASSKGQWVEISLPGSEIAGN